MCVLIQLDKTRSFNEGQRMAHEDYEGQDRLMGTIFRLLTFWQLEDLTLSKRFTSKDKMPILKKRFLYFSYFYLIICGFFLTNSESGIIHRFTV